VPAGVADLDTGRPRIARLVDDEVTVGRRRGARRLACGEAVRQTSYSDKLDERFGNEVWRPDFYGSTLFLIASVFGILALGRFFTFHRRSSRLGEWERPGLSVGVVRAAFNLGDFLRRS
jgi:hypothetical protein